MSKQTLLAIDVGTTNWKAALFSAEGNLLGQKSIEAIVVKDSFGTSYNSETLWRAISSLIYDLVTELSATPDAVCVTSMAEAGFPLGKDKNTLYNAITWFDQRSIPQAEKVGQIVGRSKLFAITGLEPNPVFTLSKILWLKEHVRSVYNAIEHWLSIADFINFCLCGSLITDYSLACRTQCFDIREKKWSDEILEACNVPSHIFPEVGTAGNIIGEVTSQSANETGLLSGTPVILGGHDHHCAFLAGGALLNDGTIFDSSGTVESVMTIIPTDGKLPETFNNMRIGNFIDPTRFVTMGGVLASGGSVEWVLKHFWANDEKVEVDYDKVMGIIKTIGPGSGGVLFLPHLTGAGAPYWDPQSRGAFIGLRMEHTRNHVTHAVFEGLCFELSILLEAVEKSFNVSSTTLNTVGGGAKNLYWQQLKADITNKIVNIPDVKDATAQGAALVAGVGIGLFSDFIEGSKTTYRTKHTIVPDTRKRELYDRLNTIYKKIYGNLFETNNELADVKRNSVDEERK